MDRRHLWRGWLCSGEADFAVEKPIQAGEADSGMEKPRQIREAGSALEKLTLPWRS
jgi:hypothetical protein